MHDAIFLIILFTCPIAAFLFTLRLMGAIFSSKIRSQIKKHRMIHIAWGCYGYVGTYGLFELARA